MMAIMLSACSSDDDYQRATVSGAQVYFPNTLGSTIETSTDATSFTVPVYRVNSEGELTVPLTISMSDGSIYTPAAQQVTFANGSKTADLVFNYNPADVVYGNYYDINVAIGGEGNATEYGVSSYAFKAGLTAWVDMKGDATYREDCITALFGVANLVYEVPCQKNVVKEGVYRIINPYGAAYGYNDPGDWDDTKDYYVTVDASDPDHVWVEKGEIGIDWGYGMMSIQSFVSYYMGKGQTLDQLKAEHPEYFGTLKGGVITMPAKSMLFSMAGYKDGAWYTANGSGLFAIALPGSRIADYSMDFNYLGRLTDASGNDFIRGSFVFGKDVYSIRYAIVDASQDTEAVAAGLIDGSIDLMSWDMKKEDAEAIEIPMDGPSGKYNIVVIVYDDSKEAVATTAFEVKYQSSKDTAETWTALYVGNYVYGAQSLSSSGALFYDDTITDEGLTLYQSDSNPNRYRIAPWCNSADMGLVFEMDDNGIIVVDGVETGEDSDYGMICATDVKTYGAADLPSYYEDGTFNFYLAYHVPAGVFAYELDTFTLTGYAQAPQQRSALNVQRTSSNLIKHTHKLISHKEASLR